MSPQHLEPGLRVPEPPPITHTNTSFMDFLRDDWKALLLGLVFIIGTIGMFLVVAVTLHPPAGNGITLNHLGTTEHLCTYAARVPPVPFAWTGATAADVMSWEDAPSIRMPGHPSADHSWWVQLCFSPESL